MHALEVTETVVEIQMERGGSTGHRSARRQLGLAQVGRREIESTGRQSGIHAVERGMEIARLGWGRCRSEVEE